MREAGMTKEIAELVDCLRHRPVATTARQMREAADLIEKLHAALHGCAWMALDADNAKARATQDVARALTGAP